MRPVPESDGCDVALARVLWTRLWAIAVIAHVIGNPTPGTLTSGDRAQTWVSLVLALLGLALIWRPAHRRLMTAVNIYVLVLFWLEAPVTRVAAIDTFVAYAPQLEDVILPQVADLQAAIVEQAAF